MVSIVETLQKTLGEGAIQQISRSIGADPNKTTNAVSMALPAILGGLSKNASNPDGAAALHNALDAHDGSIFDNLSGLIGGGMNEDGGRILGHIFGDNRDTVEQGVGKASGLNTNQVGTILTMLAPLVMGVLGREKQQTGLSASQLPNVLQESASQMQTPSLAGIAELGKSVLGNLFGKK